MNGQHEMDLTTGSIGRKLMIFGVPLMFSNLLQVVFNIADVAVVGKFAGSIELGSVGSTSILISLFTEMLIGLTAGVNVMTARQVGAGDTKRIRETVHTAALICLAAGLVLAVFGIGFARGILLLLQTKEILLSGALIYLRIYLLGLPALALYNFGNAVLSAVGDTKRPLIFLSIAGIVNVVFNLFFVIVCHWGVVGVALGSIISQYLSAFLILRALLLEKQAYGLKIFRLRITSARAGEILRVGIPSALQAAMFAIANLFVQTGVNSFDHVIVEGNSAAVNADILLYNLMAGFYTGCASFIGQNLGAGKKKRILRSYLTALIDSVAVGLILGIVIYILRTPFLSFFTNDPAVVEAANTRMAVVGVFYFVSGFMDCAIAASRGLGKTMVPTVVVILGSCVFRIVWIFTVFAWFRTLESLYLLYVFSWTLTALAENIYFVREYRKLSFNPDSSKRRNVK